MNIRKQILEKYQEFLLAEEKAKKNELRKYIQTVLNTYTNKDSYCYQILGLLDYESNDWKVNIEESISNFKKAVELDKTNVLAQLYLAHCFHDLNEFSLALEHYKKVNKKNLKEIHYWRYLKLIEQIGYCEYRLGNKEAAEKHFTEVLELYLNTPEIDRIYPSELMECLPDNHPIVNEIKNINPS